MCIDVCKASSVLASITADGDVPVKIGGTGHGFVSQEKLRDRDRSMRQWRKGTNYAHCLVH